MAITINHYPRDIFALANAANVLTVKIVATTTQPNGILTYSWSIFDANDSGELIPLPDTGKFAGFGYWNDDGSEFTVTGVTQEKCGGGNFLLCTVSDGSASADTQEMYFRYTTAWKEGPNSFLGPADLSLPIPILIDKYIKGGVHVYSSVEEMCDTALNSSRVKTGQIGVVTSYTQTPTAYRFVADDTRTTADFELTGKLWSVSGTNPEWIPLPLFYADVDGDTVQIINNQLVAIGTGNPGNVLVDDITVKFVDQSGLMVLSAIYPHEDDNTIKVVGGLLSAIPPKVDDITVKYVDHSGSIVLSAIYPHEDNKTIKVIGGLLSAVPYDQDLNTFNSVHFHDVTTNVVIENTMAIQTYAYATSSTVGRVSLNAINNSDAAQGPYNVLEVTADNKKYIPLDLTRANTFLLTLSDVSNPIGTYDGFVLINKAPLTSSVDIPLNANTTYQTFIEPESIKGRIYTITLFVKHLNVMSTLPLKLYKGSVSTGANQMANQFTVTQIPVKWSSGTYPALYTTQASPTYHLGSEDVIMYTTYDAGASWYGFIGGTDLRLS